MRASLERILAWFVREAPHLAQALAPGISRADMDRLFGENAAGFRIPEEIFELYEWRNGQSAHVPFFAVYQFQPFEAAVEHAKLAAEFSPGEFRLMVFQELNYDAGYFFACTQEVQKRTPAWHWIHGSEGVQTESLTDLVDAIAEAFEGGVFTLDARGELETNHPRWNELLVRHHPNRSRRMDALLSKQFANLDRKELGGAFHDLLRMNHPATAELVHECLDQIALDFDTFFAVLQTGIEIGDDWSRDVAIDLAIGDPSDSQRRALSLLAWRWKGPLRLTTEQADRIRCQPSDSADRERQMILQRHP